MKTQLMIDSDDFFFPKNTVKNVSNNKKQQIVGYIEAIKAFSRITYKSMYVIDYQKKGFDYVSENPLFLCGHSAEEVKEMGYQFYIENVAAKDLDLLLKINSIGFEFYENIPPNERKLYSISYDFNLNTKEDKSLLINQKLTPMFLTEDGKIWKALCIISLSSEQNSGNVKIHKRGVDYIYKYNFELDIWEKTDRIQLSDREKQIIQLSTRGYTIREIADKIFVSPDTVKFHRKNLFEKLSVNNISEAITFSINNKLL